MAKPGGTKRKPNMQDSTLRLHRALAKRVKALEYRMSLMGELKLADGRRTLREYFRQHGS